MCTCDDKMAQHFDGGRAAIMDLAGKGDVTAADVQKLRREVFANGSVSRDEAEAMFDLDRTANTKCTEWTAFFVEAITDHVVWQARPTGVVNTPQAEWLVAQVDRSKSVAALAVLVNILAEAHRVPMWLPAAARGRANAGWPGVREALDAARLELAQAA